MSQFQQFQKLGLKGDNKLTKNWKIIQWWTLDHPSTLGIHDIHIQIFDNLHNVLNLITLEIKRKNFRNTL